MSAHVRSRLIFFLSVVGNFFLVLSVVGSIFSPFVGSRLIPFTTSYLFSCRYKLKLEPRPHGMKVPIIVYFYLIKYRVIIKSY